MKKIRYMLVILFITFRLFAIGQQNMDSVQKTNSLPENQTAKELRKGKDSIAKNLTPIPDKAIVYIIRGRAGEFLYSYRIDCDSFQVGWARVGTYVYTILDPGEHLLICTPVISNECRLKVNLEPGKIYYVDITYGIGIINTVVKMKILDEGKGKKFLAACTIAKNNQYPLFPKSKDIESSPPDDK